MLEPLNVTDTKLCNFYNSQVYTILKSTILQLSNPFCYDIEFVKHNKNKQKSFLCLNTDSDTDHNPILARTIVAHLYVMLTYNLELLIHTRNILGNSIMNLSERVIYILTLV